MESRFLKIEDKQNWKTLLNRVLFKTFFHSLEWEEFLEKNFKWLKFERYLWRDQALLSLARARGKLISHPFCEYGGPLPLIEKIDGKAFQQDLFEQFKTPFKISFHPRLLDYFPGMEFPANQRESYFFEDLASQPIEQIWASMDRNRHRSIKSGQAENFQIEKCQNLKSLKILYTLYVKNLKRHRALPYPFSFFRFFLQDQAIEILLVKKDKQILGGNVFLPYHRVSHSFLCGFREGPRQLGAHSLVLWQAIQNAKKQGCQVFDFGATRKDSSIRDFKQRWGATAHPIFELKNYSGESSLRKSKLRDVYSLLPLFLIKKLSPYLLKYKL